VPDELLRVADFNYYCHQCRHRPEHQPRHLTEFSIRSCGVMLAFFSDTQAANQHH